MEISLKIHPTKVLPLYRVEVAVINLTEMQTALISNELLALSFDEMSLKYKGYSQYTTSGTEISRIQFDAVYLMRGKIFIYSTNSSNGEDFSTGRFINILKSQYNITNKNVRIFLNPQSHRLFYKLSH